jgi:hypothetical protein
VHAGLRLDMSLRRSRKRIERLMLQAGLQAHTAAAKNRGCIVRGTVAGSARAGTLASTRYR